MNDNPPIAAVDLGSNSFHLLVAREIEANFQVLHREKQKIRLASGLENNTLNQGAIDRGLAALKQFSDTLQDFHTDQVKVVATYTLRTATNIDDFLQQAAEVFPYPIEVISGQEEARLIYQGVAHYVHHDHNRFVIDIGGGSTELIIGENFKPLRLTSRNIGSASFSKRFFNEEKISNKGFKSAIICAKQELEPIYSSFKKAGWKTCLGTSGTIKSLCAIVAEKFETQQLTLEHLQWIKETFIKAEHIDALNLPGLNDDRKASICGGLAILLAIIEMFKIDSLTYCDYALREGLLHEMQDSLKHRDIRITTVESFYRRFDIDAPYAQLIKNNIRYLYQNLKKSWDLRNDEHLASLQWAAQLHEIGLSINSSGIHKHSAYIVENSLLPGFTQEQQKLLSCLIRFHRKKIRPDELPTLKLASPKKLVYLLAIIRVAILLNQKRQLDYLPNYEIEASTDTLKLAFPTRWLEEQALLNANLEQEKHYLGKLGITLLYQS